MANEPYVLAGIISRVGGSDLPLCSPVLTLALFPASALRCVTVSKLLSFSEPRYPNL